MANPAPSYNAVGAINVNPRKRTLMSLFVSIFGAVLLIAGFIGVAFPARCISLLAKWKSSAEFVAGVVVRVLLGILFLVAAPYCRHSTVVRVTGIIALLAAVSILAVGPARFERLRKWGLELPPYLMRIWSLVAVGLGLLLIWAGGWPL